MKKIAGVSKQSVTTNVTAVKPRDVEWRQHHYAAPFLSMKIENVTVGLNPGLSSGLLKIALASEDNALVIANYILAMKPKLTHRTTTGVQTASCSEL